jgi:hypothetical protein
MPRRRRFGLEERRPQAGGVPMREGSVEKERRRGSREGAPAGRGAFGAAFGERFGDDVKAVVWAIKLFGRAGVRAAQRWRDEQP